MQKSEVLVLVQVTHWAMAIATKVHRKSPALGVFQCNRILVLGWVGLFRQFRVQEFFVFFIAFFSRIRFEIKREAKMML